MNKFSIFKCFYDEYIYKNNYLYANTTTGSYLDRIKEVVSDIRVYPKYNKDNYQNKLDGYYKVIKEQLDSLFKVNRDLFEYFYLLLKSKKSVFNDKVEDLPFLISSSFYDDYRIDTKSIEELVTSSFIIPRYSSLEKKNIKALANSKSKFEYFIGLLKDSSNYHLYDKFIHRASHMVLLKPIIGETRGEFKKRIQNEIKEFEYTYKMIEENAKNSEDYEVFSELMYVAYHMKFWNWEDALKEIVEEYYNDLYDKYLNDEEIKKYFTISNDISFESYTEIVKDLISEKNKLMEEFDNGTFSNVSYANDSYIYRFREMIINFYFDDRFKSSLSSDSSVEEYVDRAIELYTLSNDLVEKIIDRVIYQSAHSPELKRHNDVNSAIINKIYDLYNPVYLLKRYDDSRLEFNKLLDNNSKIFINKVNILLANKKNEYNFHGPILSMKAIKEVIKIRKRDFIIENAITDLVSYDGLGDYDTRNYDLNYFAKDLSIDDIVSIYQILIEKIDKHDFSKVFFLGEELERNINENDYEALTMVKAAHSFAVMQIYNKLDLSAKNSLEKEKQLRDISIKYLGVEFVDLTNNNIDDSLENFNKSRDSFNKKSKWFKLLDSYKINKD